MVFTFSIEKNLAHFLFLCPVTYTFLFTIRGLQVGCCESHEKNSKNLLQGFHISDCGMIVNM